MSMDAKAFAHYERWERLRDGRPVRIRSIRHDDRQRIIDAFHKLERETIYTRFFSFKKELSEADLGRIDASDFVHAAALVATLGDGDDEVIIGGGAYTVVPDDEPGLAAEVSFTIEEDYHGQGLATLFMRLLTDLGRERGVARFVADVLPGNTAMINVFLHSGLPARRAIVDGVVHVVMDLRQEAAGPAAA
jgi:RimJ/RimL family protein N-acetyltransferase